MFVVARATPHVCTYDILHSTLYFILHRHHIPVMHKSRRTLRVYGGKARIPLSHFSPAIAVVSISHIWGVVAVVYM